MNYRRFASIGLLISGVLESVTGIFLLFDFSYKRLAKIGHEYFGYAFILFMIMHIMYNIKPLKTYFKGHIPRIALSKELLANIAIALILVLITFLAFIYLPEKSAGKRGRNQYSIKNAYLSGRYSPRDYLRGDYLTPDINASRPDISALYPAVDEKNADINSCSIFTV